ncbi:MAG: HEAT repeat domain-containing protein [Actinomycetales bacterium]
MSAEGWPGPRRSVEAFSQRVGREAAIEACLALLVGQPVDDAVVHVLAGPPARWALTEAGPESDYWFRVWALRGLLWLWDDRATAAVSAAMGDEAWRVREMAAKVAARHELDETLAALRPLLQDQVPRVRAAAARATERILGAR